MASNFFSLLVLYHLANTCSTSSPIGLWRQNLSAMEGYLVQKNHYGYKLWSHVCLGSDPTSTIFRSWGMK